MRLPNGENAMVDLRKLRDYCLSVGHPRGRHKARVFERVIGLTDEDAGKLRAASPAAAASQEAAPVNVDDYGARFVVDFTMTGRRGSGTVRSIWIIRRGEGFPRLASCYVL